MFARGESYTIKMETELPESPTNKELGMVTSLKTFNSKEVLVRNRFIVHLYYRYFDKHVFPLFSGMFMVKLQLFDKSGGVVSSSSRSVSVGENSYQPSISTAFPSCARKKKPQTT